jgi:hypothetical protein
MGRLEERHEVAAGRGRVIGGPRPGRGGEHRAPLRVQGQAGVRQADDDAVGRGLELDLGTPDGTALAGGPAFIVAAGWAGAAFGAAGAWRVTPLSSRLAAMTPATAVTPASTSAARRRDHVLPCGDVMTG